MVEVKRLPIRSDVPTSDCWDLSSLYESDQSWEMDFVRFEKMIEGYAEYKGRLSSSAQVLAECLAFDVEVDRLAERLGTYAFLKTTEDQANNLYQGLVGRFQSVAVRAGQLASYLRPEILSMDATHLERLLEAPELAGYRLSIQRIVRYREHTLNDSEEALLAMQGEMAQTASKVFRQLTDADLKFGEVENEKGEVVELTISTFSQFLISPKREVRQKAFAKYYDQFVAHENTLAAALAGSIHGDVYYARARRYPSSLDAALFPDNVPRSVYENLIQAVRDELPNVHSYFEMRRRFMGLEQIHHYDTYVPMITDLEQDRDWDEAVETVIESLAPLGNEYCEVLEGGLRGRWCDRYPNKGKQSGAFSCGTFDGAPYILMNYKPAVLNDVFTLTHEAGHSMHSYYSAGNQPFQYYNYTIFVAEVASTFNEQLLTHYLLNSTTDDRFKAYLLNHEIDSIRATIVRQTMFAEFEKVTHEMAETGQPLTVESFRKAYRQLLDDYFGPDFVIDEQLSLECLRIPHFYRGFYVYKYATGLSAAIALSRRVLEGGQTEREAYLRFLKGGCSKDPLDLLSDAGVDMSSPEPVKVALQHFGNLVKQLDELLN
ncbi:MAG: oligoendopeptidase F [Planctomycetales bacterium]|nr:oligoendopeptidase F [Planctomycetales bacterium]